MNELFGGPSREARMNSTEASGKGPVPTGRVASQGRANAKAALGNVNRAIRTGGKPPRF